MIQSFRRFERLLLYSLTLVVFVVLGMQLKALMSKPRTAFVDIGRVLDGYTFKKNLERVSANNLTEIKSVIDSFEMVRKVGAGSSKIDTQIVAAKYAFQQYYTSSNQETSKKIWERLNPLLERYGKEKGLQMLIGANGNGSLLYGNESCDVTDEVISYINNRFEKGN